MEGDLGSVADCAREISYTIGCKGRREYDLESAVMSKPWGQRFYSSRVLMYGREISLHWDRLPGKSHPQDRAASMQGTDRQTHVNSQYKGRRHQRIRHLKVDKSIGSHFGLRRAYVCSPLLLGCSSSLHCYKRRSGPWGDQYVLSAH